MIKCPECKTNTISLTNMSEEFVFCKRCEKTYRVNLIEIKNEKDESRDQKVIAIDFDGVLHDYTHWMGDDKFNSPIKDAKDYMQKLIDDGWLIVIYTCRLDIENVKRYLNNHQIPYHFVNENPHQPNGLNPNKMFAHVYLDDRAIHFNGSWSDAYAGIKYMKLKKI